MKCEIYEFINEIQAYQSKQNVFNPWRDYDRAFDIDVKAPEIRSQQMLEYLTLRIPGARYLLVAEAVGYQGGKFTGIPLTSERILLGKHKIISPAYFLENPPGSRTSNPKNINLNKMQKSFGFTEPTATIIWGEIMKNQITPYQVITWNIFPFHPFCLDGGRLTNRTPTSRELEEGVYYMKLLLKMCPQAKVISIGRHSARTLTNFGIENFHTPHPANGGAAKFKVAIQNVFNDINQAQNRNTGRDCIIIKHI